MTELPAKPDRAILAVRGVLRATVAIQCLAVARLAFRTAGTPVLELLWEPPELGGFGWSESAAVAVDHAAGWLLLAAALVTLIRPCWPVLVPVALWQLLLAGADSWLGGAFLAELTPLAHATRIVAPLALAVLDPWSRRRESGEAQRELGMGLLRGAAAVTFAIHGIEAYYHNPIFIDYLIAAARNLLGRELSQSAAEAMLLVIAAVDCVVAVLLVTTRWRSVAYYMAFWGAITALSRIVHGGWNGELDAMIRVANAGVPLAVALYWSLLLASLRRNHA